MGWVIVLRKVGCIEVKRSYRNSIGGDIMNFPSLILRDVFQVASDSSDRSSGRRLVSPLRLVPNRNIRWVHDIHVQAD